MSSNEKTGDDGDLLNNLMEQIKHISLESNLKQPNAEDVNIIPDWLKDCESPFLWQLQEKRGLGSKQIILTSLEKLEELDIDEPEFSILRFINLLKLVLEYCITGDMDRSWIAMRSVENLIAKETHRKEPDYEKMKIPLCHVISTTKAHLFVIGGEEEKSKEVAECIVPVKFMGSQDEGAIYAMKANFFLYSGYENGEEIGVKCSRKALELDPDNVEWKFLLAKILRQQRRDVPFSMDIPREELVLLESITEESKCAKYLVYLAQVYRECGSQAFRQYKDKHGFFKSELMDSIQDMSVKALNYYKEALELSPESPSILRRVGYGIMNLPKKVTDYDLALKCLKKSLEIAENSKTLHIIGTFYHRYGNDNEKALEYFEKTVSMKCHAGLCDMIRIKYLEEPSYNPCKDLESGLKWEVKKKHRIMLLAQLGGYFLLIKRDFHKCLEYFNQIIEMDKEAVHMKVFKSFFLRMNETINLYEYLANEALLLLQDKNTSKSNKSNESSFDEEGKCASNNLEYVEDFLDLISEIHPDLMEITPDPKLIYKLHRHSEEILSRNNRGKQRNDYRSDNRGGYKRYFQRGKGFFGRGHSPERSSERRGRFSVVNQRDKDQSDEFSEGRETHTVNQRGRGQNRNRHSNWREERSSEGSENPGDANQQTGIQRRKPNESERNWRKK